VLMPIFAIVYLAVLHATMAPEGNVLERTGRAYWGWLICCYALSYVPALILIEIPWYKGRNASMLFYLLLVVQFSDVMQYVWGKLLGRRQVAPQISPAKTWEGLVGGVASAVGLGAWLHWATPFTLWQAVAISLAVTIAGFVGGLAMSALKRSYSAKDFGSTIPGHGGVLDRADSLCLSAPLYYYIVLICYV
jgi:phosphatidate cytidylyltransferase